MIRNEECYRCISPDGLHRIASRGTSNGRKGYKRRWRVEFSPTKSAREIAEKSGKPHSQQRDVGKKVIDALMTMREANRLFWIRQIVRDKANIEKMRSWISDGKSRSCKFTAPEPYTHAETHGIRRIWSAGLPSLGKRS